mgnify:CR=1 FL=1
MALIVLQSAVFILQTFPITAQFIQVTIAQVSAWFYSYFDVNVAVAENRIIHTISNRYVIVDNSCTGFMLLASVCALIVAVVKPFKLKIMMIFSAFLILQFENIIRICHLFYEIQKPNNAFDFYHLYVWQCLNFITALIVLWGIKKVLNKERLTYR